MFFICFKLCNSFERKFLFCTSPMWLNFNIDREPEWSFDGVCYCLLQTSNTDDGINHFQKLWRKMFHLLALPTWQNAIARRHMSWFWWCPHKEEARERHRWGFHSRNERHDKIDQFVRQVWCLATVDVTFMCDNFL